MPFPISNNNNRRRYTIPAAVSLSLQAFGARYAGLPCSSFAFASISLMRFSWLTRVAPGS